jgi:hypothetical protein
MADEDGVVLVSSTTWCSVRAESGYHEIDSRKALWMLENLDRRRSTEVRSFVTEARLGNFDIHRMADHEVAKLIRDAIQDGRVIAVQRGAAKSDSPSTTVELRRLVAVIEKATRGKLPYRGRQHKLVVDVELACLPGRDYYEVAPQSEARAVLEGIAQESPPSANLLKQASGKLSKDWRPPFQPDGLVLLRRIPSQASAPKDDDPALTPSQMKELIERETPELDFDTDVEYDLELDFDTDAEEELALEFGTSPSGDGEEGADEEGGASDESDVEEGPGDDDQQSDEDDSDGDLEPQDAEDLACEDDTQDAEGVDSESNADSDTEESDGSGAVSDAEDTEDSGAVSEGD